MSAPRYVAQFIHFEESEWTGADAAYFGTMELARGVRFVCNMVGSNKRVQKGRLFDQIRKKAHIEVTKDSLTHTVHCFDDKDLRAHFLSIMAASRYANSLLGAGHEVKIYPYQPPKSHIDYLVEREE